MVLIKKLLLFPLNIGSCYIYWVIVSGERCFGQNWTQRIWKVTLFYFYSQKKTQDSVVLYAHHLFYVKFDSKPFPFWCSNEDKYAWKKHKMFVIQKINEKKKAQFHTNYRGMLKFPSKHHTNRYVWIDKRSITFLQEKDNQLWS